MSDVITRYDCTSGVEGTPEMEPYSHGDWVSFDDYEKLEQYYRTVLQEIRVGAYPEDVKRRLDAALQEQTP